MSCATYGLCHYIFLPHKNTRINSVPRNLRVFSSKGKSSNKKGGQKLKNNAKEKLSSFETLSINTTSPSLNKQFLQKQNSRIVNEEKEDGISNNVYLKNEIDAENSELREKEKEYSPAPSPSSSSSANNLVASRENVLNACFKTCAALFISAVSLRLGSQFLSSSGLPVNDCISILPIDFEVEFVIFSFSLSIFVTLLRFILLNTSSSFSSASNYSNKQVLSNLNIFDVLFVSFLPGISEEYFFRGFILPILGLNYFALFISALVFGSLHIYGGRNYAFAFWASFVGVLYGYSAISTSNLAVPILAHCLANLFSASLWKLQNGNLEN